MKKSLINIIFSFLFLFSCNENPSGPQGGDNLCNDDHIPCSDDGGTEVPADDCELPENSIFLTDAGDVLYHVPTDFAGIQFTVDGTTASEAFGGEAEDAGWTIQASGSTVLGFSFSNTPITKDCSLLLTLALAEEATSLSNIVFTTAASVIIDVIYYQE